MHEFRVEINTESIKTELVSYSDKPYQSLFEYVWNSFDANATDINLKYKVPPSGIGRVENVAIVDDGDGWNFDENRNTRTFLSSTKSKENSKDKTLPHGKFGRGRYAFIWFAESLDIYSGDKRLNLTRENIKGKIFEDQKLQKGTKVCFSGITDDLSDALASEQKLKDELLAEFGWFIKQNENIKLKLNGIPIEPRDNIKNSKILNTKDFPEEFSKSLDKHFKVEIVLWEQKPKEWSNFYFLNKNRAELFKKSTGLNKKGDNFWHSVYVTSNLFESQDKNIEEEGLNPSLLGLIEKDKKRTKKKILDKIRQILIDMRKPYLIKESDNLIEDLKESGAFPDLPFFGVYDEESFNDLLKAIYVISPSLFVGKSDPERKFICSTFAGLLSSQDRHLIQLILEQLQDLTEEEKKDLSNILQRTSLSSIVKTIKEIDHRLNILDKLKILLVELKQETLEVKHLQKVLDENFWIFGEQFRLFSSTEGPLKRTLLQYATDILKISDPELQSEPNGEVDLFLTRADAVNTAKQMNVIVEIKRPSIKLAKKEYDQIEEYMNRIKEQDLCNGTNQFWEFYLIGNNYDDYLGDKIESQSVSGEKERGLTYSVKDSHFKIYVRKWSDILEVEWGAKMKYLKDKLQVESEKEGGLTADDIVKKITTKKLSKVVMSRTVTYPKLKSR